MRYFYPLRSYIDSGIIGRGRQRSHDRARQEPAVNPYNPFLSIWTEVTRLTNRGKVIHPEQRISAAMPQKNTYDWAAYLQFADKERGPSNPGKVADLVVYRS